MGKKHVVKRGECLSRIARAYGFKSYRELYDHPDNAAFKARRPDPNLIQPGDELQIPERKGSKAEGSTGGTEEVKVELPLVIEAVGFVQDAEVREDATDQPAQIVNLPRDAKWVDDTLVKSKDRLGQKPRIRVRFNRPGKHPFKLQVVPGPKNAAYTGAEEGRNAHYKHETAARDYTTDDDGTKVVDDLAVGCAGKDAYAIRATGDGTAHTGPFLGCVRLVWLQELKMKGAPAATTLASTRGEYAKAGILVEQLAAEEVDRLENISADPADTTALKDKARAAYGKSKAKDKEPYVVAVAYTDHLAVKDAGKEIQLSDVRAGPGRSDVVVDVVDAANGNRVKSLWNDIVTGEGWFVSARFVKEGGTSPADEVAIPQASCTALPAAGSDKTQVQVKVSDLSVPSGTKGTIVLKVNWVNRMRAGLSIPGGNLVVICTRAWWRAESDADQNSTLVHELGHHLGMVPDGGGTGLDATPNQYTGKGHVGSHCHTGVPDQASYASAAGTCVMFGASGNMAFCPDCAKAACKVDVSKGWTAF